MHIKNKEINSKVLDLGLSQLRLASTSELRLTGRKCEWELFCSPIIIIIIIAWLVLEWTFPFPRVTSMQKARS